MLIVKSLISKKIKIIEVLNNPCVNDLHKVIDKTTYSLMIVNGSIDKLSDYEFNIAYHKHCFN